MSIWRTCQHCLMILLIQRLKWVQVLQQTRGDPLSRVFHIINRGLSYSLIQAIFKNIPSYNFLDSNRKSLSQWHIRLTHKNWLYGNPFFAWFWMKTRCMLKKISAFPIKSSIEHISITYYPCVKKIWDLSYSRLNLLEYT